jgi:hypothetical protein
MGDTASDPSLGQKVQAFASSKSGQQVGDGECFALADAALKNANAKSAADFGAVTADADYVWGTAVIVSQVQMGDILQFRNFTFTIKTVTKTTTKYADGSTDWDSNENTQSVSRPHHTAVVSSGGAQGIVQALEQNVAPPGETQNVKKVQSTEYRLANDQSKTKEVKREGGNTIEIETTTTITVSGKVLAYRPVAK